MQCTKGTCIGWAYHNITNYCSTWVIDAVFRGEQNSTDNSTKSGSQRKILMVEETSAEGSIVEEEKEEATGYYVIEDDDTGDADDSVEEYYTSFYNTNVPDTDDDSNDDSKSDYFSSYITNEPDAEDDDTDDGSASVFNDDFGTSFLAELDFCDVIASHFTTPMKSQNATMAACSFEKVKFGYYESDKECEATCQNFVSNVFGSCLIWSWNPLLRRCEGLLMLLNGKFDLCGFHNHP
eukprot:g464.t1